MIRVLTGRMQGNPDMRVKDCEKENLAKAKTFTVKTQRVRVVETITRNGHAGYILKPFFESPVGHEGKTEKHFYTEPQSNFCEFLGRIRDCESCSMSDGDGECSAEFIKVGAKVIESTLNNYPFVIEGSPIDCDIDFDFDVYKVDEIVCVKKREMIDELELDGKIID